LGGDGFTVLAGVVLAAITGWYAYVKVSKAPFPLDFRLKMQSIMAGLLFFGVVSHIWFELFHGTKWGNIFILILEIATAAMAYFFFKRWRDWRTERKKKSAMKIIDAE
jgi:hypothetical protein